jgi:RNA-directed DNA polymerase
VASDPASGWGWVDRSIWTERMLAALDNGVQGGKWFSLIDKVSRVETLRSAWQAVLKNKGAAGVDRVSVERFGSHAERYLQELSADLQAGRYVPQAVRRVEIPKGDGKVRPLGIPCVKDRVVQAAVKRVIEPIFERDFSPQSYGFRPGRGCKDALRRVDELVQQGYVHVVDADLQGYFDSIPHDRLMEKLRGWVSDGRLLSLISSWLTQDIVHEMTRWTPVSGSPQGAVISPLLANVYLHDLDLLLASRGDEMVRYADDFVILSRSAEAAQAALGAVREWVERNGLTLHPEKTHVGDCREAGQGFDFLGYRFECGKRKVRKKSRKALLDTIRSHTRRTVGTGLARVIEGLNPKLRGWFEYFKHAEGSTFRLLDAFIRRRLRSMLRKQEKRPGHGKNLDDHRRWPNAFFAQAGLFTMYEAYRTASRP